MAAEVDIAPELLEKVTAAFNKGVNNNRTIRAAAARITAGKGEIQTANRIAVEIGKELTRACETYLTPEALPNGRLYYNIADKVIRPNLEEGYLETQGYTGRVIDQINQRAGIGMRAGYQDLDRDRIHDLIDAIGARETYEESAALLREPFINLMQSAVNGMVRHNAQIQYESGLQPKVVRTSDGHPCQWCADLAGTYEYPVSNEEVWAQHEYCRCEVTFVPDKGKKHGEGWTARWNADSKVIEHRRLYGL